MEKLIKEYRDTLGGLKAFKKKKADALPGDIKLITSMIYDTSWVIRYMELGENPDRYTFVHGREVLYDPHILNDILSEKKPPVFYGTTFSKKLLKEAYWLLNNILTPREKEAFILIKVGLYSYGKAGKKMGCSKSAVESFMNRAKKKIKKYFEEKGAKAAS